LCVLCIIEIVRPAWPSSGVTNHVVLNIKQLKKIGVFFNGVVLNLIDMSQRDLKTKISLNGWFNVQNISVDVTLTSQGTL
jgi:dethiobiotin synthetase